MLISFSVRGLSECQGLGKTPPEDLLGVKTASLCNDQMDKNLLGSKLAGFGNNHKKKKKKILKKSFTKEKPSCITVHRRATCCSESKKAEQLNIDFCQKASRDVLLVRSREPRWRRVSFLETLPTENLPRTLRLISALVHKTALMNDVICGHFGE